MTIVAEPKRVCLVWKLTGGHKELLEVCSNYNTAEQYVASVMAKQKKYDRSDKSPQGHPKLMEVEPIHIKVEERVAYGSV